MTSSKTADKTRATKGTSMEKKSQTKNKKNKQSNLKPNSNGSHNDDEPEVLIVPPSSSSDSLNKDEEEAKRSDITNQQSDKAKENVKKKNGKKEMMDKSNSDTNSENVLYTFPMNRINRIIKGEDSDIRVTQEAVFLINKASEKFLELFCKEAYACSVLDQKKLIGYQHLSSVVGKRRRFDFLSDFVPEQVKAEDALKEAMPAET